MEATLAITTSIVPTPYESDTRQTTPIIEKTQQTAAEALNHTVKGIKKPDNRLENSICNERTIELMIEDGLEPTEKHLILAIERNQNLIIELLLNNRRKPVIPTIDTLNAAFKQNNFKLVDLCLKKYHLKLSVMSVGLIVSYFPKKIDFYLEEIKDVFVEYANNQSFSMLLLTLAVRANRKDLVELWLKETCPDWKMGCRHPWYSMLISEINYARVRGLNEIVNLLTPSSTFSVPSISISLDDHEEKEKEEVVKATEEVYLGNNYSTSEVKVGRVFPTSYNIPAAAKLFQTPVTLSRNYEDNIPVINTRLNILNYESAEAVSEFCINEFINSNDPAAYTTQPSIIQESIQQIITEKTRRDVVLNLSKMLLNRQDNDPKKQRFYDRFWGMPLQRIWGVFDLLNILKPDNESNNLINKAMEKLIAGTEKSDDLLFLYSKLNWLNSKYTSFYRQIMAKIEEKITPRLVEKHEIREFFIEICRLLESENMEMVEDVKIKIASADLEISRMIFENWLNELFSNAKMMLKSADYLNDKAGRTTLLHVISHNQAKFKNDYIAKNIREYGLGNMPLTQLMLEMQPSLSTKHALDEIFKIDDVGRKKELLKLVEILINDHSEISLVEFYIYLEQYRFMEFY